MSKTKAEVRIACRSKFFIPPEAKGGVQKSCIGFGRDVMRVSVTLFSSHVSEARGHKFGMHNTHMDGSKVNDQIFDILPRS